MTKLISKVQYTTEQTKVDFNFWNSDAWPVTWMSGWVGAEAWRRTYDAAAGAPFRRRSANDPQRSARSPAAEKKKQLVRKGVKIGNKYLLNSVADPEDHSAAVRRMTHRGQLAHLPHKKQLMWKGLLLSVADPGCLSRIPDFFHPGSEFFPSTIPDQHQRIQVF
jgi:hypothetical protein